MLKQTGERAGGKLFSGLLEGAIKADLDCLPKGYELRDFARAFEDADLVDTCFCLFENDLNVSKTAGKLYMHRNTLIYRIAKLKRLTGLNVCAFDDAVSFIILYRSYCAWRKAQ